MKEYNVDDDVTKKFKLVWADLIADKFEQLIILEKPIGILLGGQPGAGKSFGILTIAQRLNNNLLVINGDEFRVYHQHYEALYQQYGKDAAKYTAEFTGKMVQKVRDEAIKQRMNMVIEGTFRDVNLPLAELTNFTRQGYATSVIICTCPQEISWESTLKRAEIQAKSGLQPRYVAKEHHDLVVNKLADNAQQVFNSGKADRFEIYSRTEKLFDSDSDRTPSVAQIIQRELMKNSPTHLSDINL